MIKTQASYGEIRPQNSCVYCNVAGLKWVRRSGFSEKHKNAKIGFYALPAPVLYHGKIKSKTTVLHMKTLDILLCVNHLNCRL